VGGPEEREEVPDPYERSGISVAGLELPFLGGTWRLKTRPRTGSGSGAIGPVRQRLVLWAPVAPPFTA